MELATNEESTVERVDWKIVRKYIEKCYDKKGVKPDPNVMLKELHDSCLTIDNKETLKALSSATVAILDAYKSWLDIEAENMLKIKGYWKRQLERIKTENKRIMRLLSNQGIIALRCKACGSLVEESEASTLTTTSDGVGSKSYINMCMFCDLSKDLNIVDELETEEEEK